MTDDLDNSAPFNDDQGTRIAKEPTGAGAEAAEGIHGEPKTRDTKRNPSSKSSVTDGAADGDGRSGSEPLTSNSQDHVSGYGGHGGKPKKPNN